MWVEDKINAQIIKTREDAVIHLGDACICAHLKNNVFFFFNEFLLSTIISLVSKITNFSINWNLTLLHNILILFQDSEYIKKKKSI